MPPDTRPVLVIVGPTAVGKTALALALARALPLEVVSADSRQVYRGMDIGTAKPTPAELAAVRHHCIDVVAPDQAYTLAHYRQDARAAIDDIRGRGLLAALVGGTGLYVQAVTEGLDVPEVAPDHAFREAAQARAQAGDDLHAELAAVDPVAAEHIDPRNLRRVVRALEVQRATGRPFSTLRTQTAPPYPLVKVGLTMDRVALYRRADDRVDAMMTAGLLDEVRRLHAAGYGWELQAMSGIGYRQLGDYLRGEATLDEAVQRIKFETHALIRRQYTWFRRDGGIEWHPAEGLGDLAAVLADRLRR